MQTNQIYDCTPDFVHSHVFGTSRYNGKERGAESRLDYFGAKYYGSTMDRFMAPDWSKASEVALAEILALRRCPRSRLPRGQRRRWCWGTEVQALIERTDSMRMQRIVAVGSGAFESRESHPGPSWPVS
jgi:hypothetical protein